MCSHSVDESEWDMQDAMQFLKSFVRARHTPQALNHPAPPPPKKAHLDVLLDQAGQLIHLAGGIVKHRGPLRARVEEDEK